MVNEFTNIPLAEVNDNRILEECRDINFARKISIDSCDRRWNEKLQVARSPSLDVSTPFCFYFRKYRELKKINFGWGLVLLENNTFSVYFPRFRKIFSKNFIRSHFFFEILKFFKYFSIFFKIFSKNY